MEMTLSQRVKRVLLVDDYELQLRAWKRELSKRGLDCSLAQNRDQALAAARAQPHQLAIVDFYVGLAYGLDIADELRAIDPAMAIIIVSADLPVDGAVRAVLRGAQWACNKPINWAAAIAIANGEPPPAPELGVDEKDYDECMKQQLERALVKTLGNQTAAADWLKMHRTSFIRRCEKLGVKLPRRRRKSR